MTPTSVSYRRIYVWELPVRAFHWINAAAITVLGLTGFIIGHPFSVAYTQEASFQYWFGTVRFIHFLAGYIFLINMLMRIYWGFVGNAYSNWKEFIPTSRSWIGDIKEVLKVDILQTSVHGPVHVGHNRLAGLIYFGTFWMFLFQALTGFALYAPMSRLFVGKLATWIVPILGGDQNVRHLHHTMLWFYVAFAIVHVYLVFYHDYVEGRGTTSSMVGGWKFEREDYLDKH
ncbi:MAG: Ni/Fe-hydrogenase 1 B-type cytochrome subunit [Holophagaceae bacterium]|nr:Ni/Fe-hydrogenase 1 B-type cytochrome subunit [Holophagaceae bacterium]